MYGEPESAPIVLETSGMRSTESGTARLCEGLGMPDRRLVQQSDRSPGRLVHKAAVVWSLLGCPATGRQRSWGRG